MISGPAPHKRDIPFRLHGNSIQGWQVSWLPSELGVHTIEVKYGNKHVVGSPFKCRVYDLTKVKLIRDLSTPGLDLDGIPGEDIVFYGK